MTDMSIVVTVSIVTAGLTIAIGVIAPALGEGRALSQALDAIARQPDEADRIGRTLFVGMAIIESLGIYALVIALIILFANPLVKLIQ